MLTGKALGDKTANLSARENQVEIRRNSGGGSWTGPRVVWVVSAELASFDELR